MPSTTNSPTSSVTAESRSTAPSCQRRSATLQQPRLRPFPAAQTGALHLLNILATACRASPVPISVLATMRRTESVVCLAVAGRHTHICAPAKFCVAGSVCWTHQALLPAVRSKEADIKGLQAKLANAIPVEKVDCCKKRMIPSVAARQIGLFHGRYWVIALHHDLISCRRFMEALPLSINRGRVKWAF